MKNLFASLILITLAGCCGVPQEARDQAHINAVINDQFIKLMEDNKTTREHEQAFIQEQRRAWHAQDNSLNDALLPPDMVNDAVNDE